MKVVAFDLFGTVFDLSGVPREEIVSYIDQIERDDWAPLKLPASWERLPAFADSKEGIDRIRRKRIVVTCSNAPLGLQIKLCKNAGIQFDGHIPLELAKAYKPHNAAYMTVCNVLGVQPYEVTMVTGNARLGRNHWGDAEYAAALGMESWLIRQPQLPENPATITALAEIYGC